MTKGQSGQGSESKDGSLVQFSLLGGPFHDLVARVVFRFGGDPASVAGAALSVALWLILALLATAEGHADRLFSLQAAAIHARLLVALPLIFLCHVWFDRSVRDALTAMVRLGVIAGDAKVTLDKHAGQLARLSRSWLVQLVLMIAVVTFSIVTPSSFLPGVSGSAGNASVASDTIALQWYWLVCLPVFRFVFARFLFVLCIWSYLVWQISRVELRLTAEHPDRTAGLGLFEIAQEKLMIFVVALAVLDAAGMAETYHAVALSEPEIYLHVFLVALFGLVVVCGPLLFLMAPIYRCQRVDILEHNAFAHDYAVRFREQWLAPGRPDRGELLASGEDIQSLASLEVYWRVRTMRVLPVTGRLLFVIFSCAAVPHLPLLLLKYPMVDLVSNMLQKIIGF